MRRLVAPIVTIISKPDQIQWIATRKSLPIENPPAKMNIKDNVTNNTNDLVPVKFKSIFNPTQDYAIGIFMLIVGK